MSPTPSVALIDITSPALAKPVLFAPDEFSNVNPVVDADGSSPNCKSLTPSFLRAATPLLSEL